jgi:hypothetical protein
MINTVIGTAFLVTTLAVLTLSLSTASPESESTGILFIGNSLTSVNDLPKLTADLARESGRSVSYTTYAPRGRRFSDHSIDKQLMQLIKKREWDYVVLQKQSQYPAFTAKQVKRDVYPFAKDLVAAVKKSSPAQTSCST